MLRKLVCVHLGDTLRPCIARAANPLHPKLSRLSKAYAYGLLHQQKQQNPWLHHLQQALHAVCAIY